VSSFAGPWSECSEECGGGTQTRSVACIHTTGLSISEPAANSMCESTGQVAPQRQRSCNLDPCNSVMPERAGTEVMNVNALGIPSRAELTGLQVLKVHLEARKSLPLPATQANVAHQQSRQGRALASWTPGVPAAWSVSSWSTCNSTQSVLSPMGQQARSVRCLGIASQEPQDEFRCFSASKPAASRLCFLSGVPTCALAGDNVLCGNAGTCAAEECQCQGGTRGLLCQVSATCATVLDGLGTCCASALVSAVTGADRADVTSARVCLVERSVLAKRGERMLRSAGRMSTAQECL
jgi:hypothetical protein